MSESPFYSEFGEPDPQDGDPAVATSNESTNPSLADTPNAKSHLTAMRPEPFEPKTVGDFELIKEVGRGGMGVVFQARQLSLERTVALKLLPDSPLITPVVVERFLAEARAAASLAHPSIITIYQVGQCPLGNYLTMEFIDGQSLEAILKKHKLPISWTLSLMISVADAVHFAHSKGIVHRDLKPGNIMINQLRRPVVMDFGIAKVMGRTSTLTQIGELVGTPYYMSPEQARQDNQRVGPLSDVFSLGAILYHMLTGKVPFEGNSAAVTLLKVVSPDPPPSIRAVRPEVDAELENICLKALGKKTEDRFPSAQALAQALREYRSQTEVSKTTTGPILSDAEIDLTPIAGSETMDSASDQAPAGESKVRIFIRPNNGKEIRLKHLKTIIGRNPDCDIVLRSDQVSKYHCRIRLKETGEVILDDLQSTNGTFVNGDSIRRHVLQNGDEVAIAKKIKFIVRLEHPTD